jgi:enterochelin esterase family protein
MRYSTTAIRAILAAALLLPACWPASGRAALGQVKQQSRVSPRIVDLRRQVEAGNRAAVESFWDEMARQGTPLVEPIKGDDRHMLLTFLWRGKDDTKNVVVFAGLGAGAIENNRMARLLDTDVWYKTYRVRDDLRSTYYLSPNDSLIPFDEIAEKDIPKREASFQHDPLNPNVFAGSVGFASVVELPAAPEEKWLTRLPDVARGNVEQRQLKSAILGNERKTWIYTPAGYRAAGGPYGLLLFFDGPAYVYLIPTPIILDNLIAKGHLPPLVAVFLDNPTRDSRETEFACHQPYADFIAREAVPWIRKSYHVTRDPARTAVGGLSFGGLAATYIGLRHPNIFGNVIAQSGSFWWKPETDEESEWLTRQFVASRRLPLRFYLDVGLLENSRLPGDAPDMVTASRHLRDVLRARGYEVHYSEFNGGHTALNWRVMLPEALIALMGRRSKR